jgi:predicted nucleic acid-binding protein
LLIASTAGRERLTVLCDDRDYLTVAAITGQPVKLVTDI